MPGPGRVPLDAGGQVQVGDPEHGPWVVAVGGQTGDGQPVVVLTDQLQVAAVELRVVVGAAWGVQGGLRYPFQYFGEPELYFGEPAEHLGECPGLEGGELPDGFHQVPATLVQRHVVEPGGRVGQPGAAGLVAHLVPNLAGQSLRIGVGVQQGPVGQVGRAQGVGHRVQGGLSLVIGQGGEPRGDQGVQLAGHLVADGAHRQLDLVALEWVQPVSGDQFGQLAVSFVLLPVAVQPGGDSELAHRLTDLQCNLFQAGHPFPRCTACYRR